MTRAALAERAPRVVDDAVARLDGWRRPLTGPVTEAASYKEWMHFCVRLPGDPPGHLLVNFNVTERRLATCRLRTPRMIAMCDTDRWRGEVQTFGDEAVAATPGRVDVRMGSSHLRWRDDAFEVRIDAADLAARLRIRPLVLPTVTSSVSFGPGHAMHWVVIPRLEASGFVDVGGRRLTLERALTYHDHNWGHFRWGEDLSWEWGFVNPDDPACPWSIVFVRVSDGGRHRTLSQGVLVWKDDVNVRTFQNREIDVSLEGSRAVERPVTIPPIAGLLVPGASSGVPARLALRAGGSGDGLALDYEVATGARIVVPSDVDDFGCVILNETAGPARVRGSTRAGDFDFTGPAIAEFVRG
jgi:hypothetical protein